MKPYIQQQTITPEELKSRGDIFILSEQGVDFRHQLIEERKQQPSTNNKASQQSRRNQQSSKSLLHIGQSNSQSMSTLGSIAQISLIRGPVAKPQLLAEFPGIEKLPYINQTVNRSINGIIQGRNRREINFTEMNTKLYGLHEKLNKVNALFTRRNSQSQHSIKTQLIEEDELNDRVSALTHLEQRIERMSARYSVGKQLQQKTKEQIQEEIQRKQEELRKRVELAPPQSIFEDKDAHLYRQSNNLFREKLRIAEYSKKKYKKHYRVPVETIVEMPEDFPTKQGPFKK